MLLALNGKYFLGLFFLFCLGIFFSRESLFLRLWNGASADQEDMLKESFFFLVCPLKKKKTTT